MLTYIISIHSSVVVTVQQYKYRDLTVREMTNVISEYKDLKPVMDAYGKMNDIDFLSLTVFSVK